MNYLVTRMFSATIEDSGTLKRVIHGRRPIPEAS